MSNRIILNETSYFGSGAIASIADEIKKRGFKRAMLVTDRDLIKFNVAQKVIAILDFNKMPYAVFDDIQANPTIENVQAGVAFCNRMKFDYIIAVGGGSVIDTAKAIAIIAKNPEHVDVASLEGAVDTENKSLPLIAVPTTAGTAAEVTINYVITDTENRRKFVCVDPHDIPIVAVIDPDMMASMPKSLTASTGMDALTHAIESYICKGAWEMSDMFALEAIKLIGRSLEKVTNTGNSDARQDLALAQYVAGMGFSNVGLGIVHSMAHPLGAVYDTPHGVANAIILPTVMEYNAPETGNKYQKIAKALGVLQTSTMSPEEYRKAAIDAVKKLSVSVGIPAKLSDVGVKLEDVDFLAESAFADVCTGGNPRTTSVEEIAELYKSML
ncbi:MAG: lactaldehyde reductase [Oscillospiraceae bacterium]